MTSTMSHSAVQAADSVPADTFRPVRLPRRFDPHALLERLELGPVVASYERPDRQLVLVGIGEAARVESAAGIGGTESWGAVRELLSPGLSPAAEHRTPELRPRLLGGFAFRGDRIPGDAWRGFPCGLLVLPRMLFVRDGDVTGVVLAPGVPAAELDHLLERLEEPSAPPPDRTHANGRREQRAASNGHGDGSRGGALRVAKDLERDAWRESVATVAAEVRAGRYEKAVLAAQLELAAGRPIVVGDALARLREDYPHCHLFTFSEAGATFFGASPELLVERRDGMVTALGLAGSAPRGDDAAADRRFGEQLLGSAKERIEQEIVVRALREGLRPVTEELCAPNQPSLLQLRNIQHLATEVSGRARDGVHVLELVGRLHPTPAVCGWPTPAARRVIEAHERFDRGWYAGPIGWVDGEGDGEFAVALRSALVRDDRAWLFAGAGIMGDSRPEAELAEIELKFRPLAGALAAAAGASEEDSQRSLRQA